MKFCCSETVSVCHNVTGRCYWWEADSTTWDGARGSCQSDGGDLAVMETKKLWDFVQDEIRSVRKILCQNQKRKQDVNFHCLCIIPHQVRKLPIDAMLKCSKNVFARLYYISVAHLRGEGIARDAHPPGSKFFQFHAVFGKFWQNCMLASPWGIGAPSSGKS